MLHLILGRAGSGKTLRVRSLLAEQACAGADGLVLLVPEQYSFESERAMLRLTGPQNAARVEVLSFTRLTAQLFKEYGGIAGERIDDAGRIAAMGRALSSLADQLVVYRRFANSTEFTLSALEAVRELKLCAIPPRQLMEASAKAGQPDLQAKGRELALIAMAYDAQVARHCVNSEDDLTRLCDLLEEHHHFAGKTVVLDSFKGFTGQQKKVLERIIAQAKEVFITLCTDSLEEKEGGLGLFSNIKATARQLIDMARRHGVKVAAPEKLGEPRRFACKELSLLEQGLSGRLAQPVSGQTEFVTLCAAQTPYEEADYVARTIARLVREEGLRYREVAVIARSAEDYRGIIDAAFERYHIPCFMDRRKPLDYQPLMQFVTRALNIALYRFRSDDLFACLKTGLWGLTVEEISLLENYTFVWGITGELWLVEWKSNPDGIGEGFSDSARERLVRINELRKRVTEPLAWFSDKLQSVSSAKEMARAVYLLLERVGAAEALRDMANGLEKALQPDEADVQRRTWDFLMHTLDQLAEFLEGEECSPAGFQKFYTLLISAQDLGSIPQGVDEVSFGSAERMRPAEPRVVFLIGANEGVFPAAPGRQGLFTESQRRRLAELGVELGDECEQQVVEEKFLCYTCLCAASKRVYLSYHRCSAAGEGKNESELVRRVKQIFPQTSVRQAGAYLYASNPEKRLAPAEALTPAKELMAKLCREESVFSASLKAALERQPSAAGFLAGLEAVVSGKPASLEPERAKKLFGQRMALSPTGVEVFHKCRFSYFCKYGMRARPLRSASLDVSEKGTLVHYCLEMLLEEYGSQGLSHIPTEELQRKIHELIDGYVVQAMGGWEDKTARFRFLIHRIEVMLGSLVEHLAEELGQSEFITRACEVTVGLGDCQIDPVELTLPSGGSIRVNCIIDRLDTYEKDGVTYYRVVDYKTGTRTFRLDDVMCGLGLQMLLYLHAAEHGGERLLGKNRCPAGVLYMPAKRASVRADGDGGGEEDRQEDLRKCLKMRGVLLDNELTLRAMEPDGRGIFIPAAFTSSGKVDMRVSRVASLAFFGQMSRRLDKLLVEMGECLHSGDIAADPLDSSPGSACQYCDYHAVCPLDESAPHKRVPSLGKERTKAIFEGRGEESDETDR